MVALYVAVAAVVAAAVLILFLLYMFCWPKKGRPLSDIREFTDDEPVISFTAPLATKPRPILKRAGAQRRPQCRVRWRDYVE
jgi:hypothetical protein